MESNDTVMLVEDDRLDQKSVQRAFKELRISNPLVIVSNGLEALEYLHRQHDNLPVLILLDLNMPRMNGIEFLRALRSEDPLKALPVVVLTTSKEEQDQVESFELGVAGYMLKPVDYHKFIEVIRTIHVYWQLSRLPQPGLLFGKDGKSDFAAH